MVEVLYGESVEQIPLWWRPALRQHHRFSECGLLIQVGEYLVDDHGIFDTGDNFDRTATLGGRDFWRLHLGIDRPANGQVVVVYVLGCLCVAN